jgi:UDP-glucose 4-epimerase
VKKLLITGGAGFIGSHLAEELLKKGNQTAVLDDLSTGSLENIFHLKDEPNFTFVLGSVMDEDKLDELVKDCEEVYHLAAVVGVKLVFENPVQTILVNVKGTQNVLNSCLKFAKKILVVSTSEVYGKNVDPKLKKFHEDLDLSLGPSLRWSYACSKALDEYLTLSYHKKMGLPTVVVRAFNTVGPRQSGAYGMVIPRLVGQALSGQPLTVYGDGEQVRSFSWVKDIVWAMIELMDKPEANGQIFNLGSEEEVTINQLAQRIKAKTESPSAIVHISYQQAYGKDFEDIRYRVPDMTKLKSVIPFKPTLDLSQILDRIIASHKGK